jgi:peptidoglycan/xylan/chitin deacetylase (PgdA/CDA1 family)
MMVLSDARVNRWLPRRNVRRCVVLAVVLILSSMASPASARQRTVAITIDDLPANSTRADIVVHRSITERLLATLVQENIPAIGFVIEGHLEADGRTDSARVDLLRQWLDAGMDLGNHSFSHRSLNQVALESYEADVLRGERTIRRLLMARGKSLTWYRHPMLHTGRSMAVKADFARFLEAHDYRIAPVTIDNQEWIFARAYDVALDRCDRDLAGRIAAAYLPYMDSIVGYYERQSIALLGREPAQILLLHANRLNAEYLDDLIGIMRRRGYRFVSLEDAMRDPAYARPDTYTGPAGITWLHRWALAEGWTGSDFAGEPDVPAFVS